MIDRITELSLLMEEFPAVTILGPRQVGKSTLAREFAKNAAADVIFLDMESHADRLKLHDIEQFLISNSHKLVVIDEAQLMPELFSALRPAIDQFQTNGRYLLTGSANPALVRGVSESLAGRIAHMPLHPITFAEALSGEIDIDRHWFRGGFPKALLASTDSSYHRWMDNYINSYIERDLRILFDHNLAPPLIRNIWMMVANNHSGILNLESYANALGVSSPTIKKYMQFLEGSYLIRMLRPYAFNSNKRLVKSPKLYIRDTGILHHFLNIRSFEHLNGYLAIGASWEGYVIEEIAKVLPLGYDIYYYRTHHGAEIDLVITNANKPIYSIEIKNSLSPKISDGYYHAIEDLKTVKNFIIYRGKDRFSYKNGIEIIGLEKFMEDFNSHK